MYPAPLDCTIDVGRVADHLCGRTRPGHFRGVATVVMKLFQIAQPGRAYFGEKDAQQLAVIRRLVADLNVPVTIVPVATVREPDGLALSSRNRRLSPEDRRVALILHEAPPRRTAALPPATRTAHVRQMAAGYIHRTAAGRDAGYSRSWTRTRCSPSRSNRPVVAAGAVWIGSTRLIDNVVCVPPVIGQLPLWDRRGPSSWHGWSRNDC
jgi:pantoate--beta-alanine ligase